MGLQVDPDQVHQSKYSSFRYTHGLADDRISFFDGKFIFKGEPHGAFHP